MILAHIAVQKRKQAKEIAKLLLQKNLIFSARISTKKIFEKNQRTGLIHFKKQTIVSGKTKALLFNNINQLLKKTYPATMPMVYAVPIIYMDEEQIQLLRNQTAKV